jgi:glycosyltransferase involved in cell wall biosynthesis
LREELLLLAPIPEDDVKILFVSDSLGAPIEQRGIHNFSMSFIEILQGLGGTVDLLVERPSRGWMADKLRSKVVDLAVTRKSVSLAEVFRFFGRRGYNTGWISSRAERRYALGFALKMRGRAYIAMVRLLGGAWKRVENDPALVDFIPAEAWHLSMPDNFVIAPSVYTEMVVRAGWGLPPSTIDAAGYDLVVVDTPMYFKVSGIDPKRIVSVVHDIIPIRDPMMNPYWRNLFLRKLEAMLALTPNFAFVSEYSRHCFAAGFPDYKVRNSFILYPSLRKSVIRRAAQIPDKSVRRYAPEELKNLEASVELQEQLEAEKSPESLIEKRIMLSARFQRREQILNTYLRLGWDSRLPYFVTVVSDEPRKNISILIKAFMALKGRANMVVLGNVDGRRYVGENPNDMGHIRFTGYIPEGEKSRILSKADGLIFPSFTEGFGIPITEGAAYGKPVICSDIEVFREVAGEDAYYFDPYKEDTLVAAVTAVIEAPQESQRRALQLKRRVLERFVIDAMSQRVGEFLRNLGLSPRAQAVVSAEPAQAKAETMG